MCVCVQFSNFARYLQLVSVDLKGEIKVIDSVEYASNGDYVGPILDDSLKEKILKP